MKSGTKDLIRNAMVSARSVLITAYHENSIEQLRDSSRMPVIERRITQLNEALEALEALDALDALEVQP